MTVRIGERFKPDPSFKTLQYVYLLIAILFLLPLAAIIIVPISFFNPWFAMVVAFFLAIFFLILISSIIWINLYYSTIFYTFTEDEILVERGVWWKHKSIVPYNRITNIDIRQGPVSRILGLWELRSNSWLPCCSRRKLCCGSCSSRR